MLATEVDVCNHALSMLGESRITSLEDNTERARICNVIYDETRDELLADFEWPFAVDRRALAAVSETNLTPFEYKYALPSDYLMLLDILDDDTYDVLENYKLKTLEYKIEGNKLLIDLSPCYVRYIKRVTTPNLYPESFTSALVYSIAAKIAPRLSQNFGLAQQMGQMAMGALLKAKADLTKTSIPRPTRYATWSETN